MFDLTLWTREMRHRYCYEGWKENPPEKIEVDQETYDAILANLAERPNADANIAMEPPVRFRHIPVVVRGAA